MRKKITKDKGGFKSRPVHHNRTPNISEKIFNVLWQLKKDGYAEETIKGYSKRLRHLEQNTDIDKPEQVKAFISQKNVSNAYNSRDYKIIIKMAPRTNIMSHIGNDILMDFD